jgi:hypothetical protein
VWETGATPGAPARVPGRCTGLEQGLATLRLKRLRLLRRLRLKLLLALPGHALVTIALLGPILQLVNDSLVVLARAAQLVDVFLGDVLLALRGSLNQAKVRGLGVLELSFAPLLLAFEVFDQVH